MLSSLEAGSSPTLPSKLGAVIHMEGQLLKTRISSNYNRS